MKLRFQVKQKESGRFVVIDNATKEEVSYGIFFIDLAIARADILNEPGYAATQHLKVVSNG